MKSKRWWIGAVCGKVRLGFIIYANNLVDAIIEGGKVAKSVDSECFVVSVDEISNR